MAVERTTRSSSRGSSKSGGEETATPSTPTPQQRKGLYRTPPGTAAVDPVTATKKGKKRMADISADTSVETTETPEATETPMETGESSQGVKYHQETVKPRRVVYMRGNPARRRGNSEFAARRRRRRSRRMRFSKRLRL